MESNSTQLDLALQAKEAAVMASLIRVVRIMEVPPAKLDAPEVARAYWTANIETKPDHDPCKEYLYVFILDTKYNIVGVNMVSCGSLNESIAHPREIFRPVIAMAGYAFLLVHNHPSGDPSPSEADRRLTARIHEGARLLQVQMLDHVIMGTSGDGSRKPFFSFKEAGLI